MLKSARFLSRSMLNNLGIVFLFEGVCAVGVALIGNAENIFGTYLGTSTMMILIITMIMGVNWTQILLPLSLGMGSTRKGMWGAIQLNLAGAALGGVLLQAALDQVADRWAPRVSMSLPARGDTLLLLVVFLLLVGNLGALTGMMKVAWAKVLFVLVLMLTVLAGTLLGMGGHLGWLDADTRGPVIFWTTAVCLALTAVCAAWLHKRLRTVQVQAM